VPTAIRVRDLHKRYGDTVAVEQVDLAVETGEVFAILGRNGAGKTTTVESIAGLRRPDRGSIEVLGLDPQRDRDRLPHLLGVQLQSARLHGSLTVDELLTLYRSFYADAIDPDELLRDLGLEAQRGTRFDSLSGGQQQRLSVALALIGRPRVAILDELTTGLDPEARRDAWRLIERLRDDGVTVVLVTHGTGEAERLADRVAIIDAGRVAAVGSPDELIAAAVARLHDADPDLAAAGPTRGRVADLEDAYLVLTDRQLSEVPR
jgi:ABC-2 type transport system ATP-binding protein